MAPFFQMISCTVRGTRTMSTRETPHWWFGSRYSMGWFLQNVKFWKVTVIDSFCICFWVKLVMAQLGCYDEVCSNSFKNMNCFTFSMHCCLYSCLALVFTKEVSLWENIYQWHMRCIVRGPKNYFLFNQLWHICYLLFTRPEACIVCPSHFSHVPDISCTSSTFNHVATPGAWYPVQPDTPPNRYIKHLVLL